MKNNRVFIYLFLFLIASIAILAFIVISTRDTSINENEVASESQTLDGITSSENHSNESIDIIDKSISIESTCSNTDAQIFAQTTAVEYSDSFETNPTASTSEECETTTSATSPKDEDAVLDNADFFYTELTEPIINRIYGLSYKVDCPIPYDSLRYVSILYYDFNGDVQTGELICNKSIANDFVEIFKGLYKAHYPLERVRLVDEYNADDTLSMLDNNTSCFNYRVVDGTTNISKHGLGLAIDVNPFYNPYIKNNSDGSLYISPAGSEIYADRSLDFPYKIDENDLCYKLFTAHGFKWGGHYKTIKDYQHFYKEK